MRIGNGDEEKVLSSGGLDRQNQGTGGGRQAMNQNKMIGSWQAVRYERRVSYFFL
jgi:hypothetical protein